MSWYDKFKTGTLDYLTRGSYSKQKTKTASSFWADEWSSYDYSSPSWYGTAGKVQTQTHDLMKLNAHKRAISNFVNILTNRNIPVKFAKKGDSYTDGKSVVLSADVKPEKFDVAVGLALHEASHIVLTDFELLPKYKPNKTLTNDYMKSAKVDVTKADAVEVHQHEDNLFNVVKSLVNFVEDRRIDHHIYKTCPGYRDYYRALYDEYFYDKVIDKGLKSDEYTDETLESYMFRIINITNENTDLSKLKGLKEIYDILDLKHIDRLKSTKDSLEVAEKMMGVMLQNINQMEMQKQQKQKGQGDGDVNEDDEVEIDDLGDDFELQEGDGNGGKPVKLSARALEQLKKAIKKQKDFVDNNLKKKTITNKEEQSLDQIDKSGTTLENVGDTKLENGGKIAPVQCVVSKKMTEELMKDDSFPFAHYSNSTNKHGNHWSYWNDKTLQRGLLMGTILGKRIAVRSEERETVNPRQKNGRIDKRMVAALGYDYVNVFSTKEVDRFKKVALHITLDGSGSMSGRLWDDALAVAIAVCKAATMVSNLEVQVSIRGTWGDKPYICIAYDSRIEKFEKVKRLFPALQANGTTPEGLCYQAIMKHFVESNKDMDSYLLNICDGEPTFSNQQCTYGGENAVLHTKKMVNQIREMGINVMAYFVGDSYGRGETSSQAKFKKMYGSDSRFIDVTQVVPITKTLNELFLKK